MSYTLLQIEKLLSWLNLQLVIIMELQLFEKLLPSTPGHYYGASIFLIEKCKSESMKITCGVPQGSILGPLLFLIYFNDFEKCLKNAKSLSFADDTVIYIEGKTKENIDSQLNDDLRHVSSYFQSNQLVINLKKGKTEAMLFGTSKRLSSCSSKLSLLYDNKAIETTETYKYLFCYLYKTT